MRLTEAEYRDLLKNTEVELEEGTPYYDKNKILEAIEQAHAKFDAREPILMRDIEEPGPKFASKTEERAWYEWIPTTEAVQWYYEPFRLYLKSGSYRPDFALVMPDRELHLIEVKGSWHAYISGRSSKKSVKEAAKLYWWLARFFTLLPVKGGGWDLQEIT